MNRYNNNSYWDSSCNSSGRSSSDTDNSSWSTTPSVRRMTLENCLDLGRSKPILDINKVEIPLRKRSGNPSAEPFPLNESFSLQSSVKRLAQDEQILQEYHASDAEKREAARNLFQSLQKARGVPEQETSRIMSELETPKTVS